MCWNKRLRLLRRRCIGVSRFTVYTYVLAKILQNDAKFIQKLTPGFKNHIRNSDNSIYILHKYIYTEDLSNIIFNYLCENSLNFWNHKSIFTIQLLYTFLAQTLHSFYKSNPSKCKFLDFLLLAIIFKKFLMSFFKQKVSFSSKFESLFIVMRDNSSVPFYLKLYMLLTKVTY